MDQREAILEACFIHVLAPKRGDDSEEEEEEEQEVVVDASDAFLRRAEQQHTALAAAIRRQTAEPTRRVGRGRPLWPRTRPSAASSTGR